MDSINSAGRYTFSSINPLEVGRKNQNVGDEVRTDFQSIVKQHEDFAKSGRSDKQFLASLHKDQLETLRIYHGLVDVNMTQMSEEGAHNLVVDADDMRDLDGDGYVNIGGANMFLFPPPGARPEVYEAFAKLSPEEQQTVYQAAFSQKGVQDFQATLGIRSQYPLINGEAPLTSNTLAGMIDFLENQRRYGGDSEEFHKNYDAIIRFRQLLEEEDSSGRFAS